MATQQIPDFFEDINLEENKIKPVQKTDIRETKQRKVSTKEVPDFFAEIAPDRQPVIENIQANEPEQPKKLPVKQPSPDFIGEIEQPKQPSQIQEKPLQQRAQFDPVSEELRRQGIEPDFGEELERAQEKGTAEGIRSLTSGATAGISERVPGMKPEEGTGSDVYRFVGSFLPLSIVGKGVNVVANLAKTSKIAPKALSALSKITGWGVGGAAYGSVEDLARHGEMPTAENIAKHGALWAGIEAALMGAGKLGSFSKKLINYAKNKKIPRLEAVDEVLSKVKDRGIDVEKNPEEAVKAAEEILGEAKPEGQKELKSTELVDGKEPEAISKEELRASPAKMEIEAIEPSSQKVESAAKEIEKVTAKDRTPEQTQVVALSKEAQPGDPAEKLFENTPIPDAPSFMQRIKGALLKPKTELSEQLNQMKEEYYSKKWGLEWDSRHKWNTMLKEKKFSPKELSDMQFYIENPEAFGGKKSEPGTGNPFVGEHDTYDALANRLSPEAKSAVDEVITPHFKQWVKTINESAYTKKINPREFLESVYVPHFYSGDSKKGAKQAAEMLSKRFSTNNPFANMRTLLTYNEALQKAGMKPRFDNIADLLNEYDRIMIRVLNNSEFAGKIAELEKDIGSKLIVRSNSSKYAEAKREGWVPFQDPYLRRYVAGTDKSGKPIFATLETPALVHPEAAEAFTGIFVKDAQNPQKGGEMALWKGYDALSDLLKSLHVSFSGFHYLTLAEESGKASGINMYKNFVRGGKLLEDPVFMKEYVQAGGVIGHNPELLKKAGSNVQAIEQALMSSGPSKVIAEALKGTREVLQKPSKFLFEEFQPRLKVAAFYDMRSRYLGQLSKKGIVPDAKQMKQINKELAALSNDMFGGQRFELMHNPTNFKALDFNDPSVLKGWKRAGGYVDWTASAIREFGKTAKGLAELVPGVAKTPTGSVARQNFWNYGKNLFVATQMMNYMTTGLTRDKEGKLNWDYNKAHSTFQNEDPSKNALDIELPDIELEIGGHKFNPGRDSKGRRLHTHFGKKLLENFHWLEDPIKQLFNKGNPVWQALFVQAAGGQPSFEGIPFKAEPAFIRGESKPWEGKKGWGTLKPRIKHLFKSALPFSLQHLTQEDNVLQGLSRYVLTGLGSLPIRKGMNLTNADEYYDVYFHNEKKYQKEIDTLDHVLKNNGYNDKQIKTLKTRVRNRLKEENE